MASPIEDLHEFDLHIYVGTRSWPDDLEEYCEVTFPGVDTEHPITKNYMYMAPNIHLSRAIEIAIRDIAAYMKDPHAWTDDYYSTTESAEGRLRYQLHRVEEEIAEKKEHIKNCHMWITGSQNVLQQKEAEAQRLRGELERL